MATRTEIQALIDDVTAKHGFRGQNKEPEIVAALESMLTKAGGDVKTITNADSPYTALVTDGVILVDASGGPVTVVLQPAAIQPELRQVVKKTDASVNAVTVDGDGAETIDGAANASLANQNDFVDVISDGTNYQIVGTNF